jgi:hypothetical protein
MKTSSALVILCLATLILATASPLAFAKKSPFVDFWTATDPVDGSTLTAHIYGSPQGALHFYEYDNYASGCISVLPADPNEVPVGTLTGAGTLTSPDVLAVSGQVTCIDLTTGATVVIPGYYVTFTYNPSTDTMLSSWNELFHRI